MSDGTAIEWSDATWNPITGCSVVSAGCKHCYAMKLAGTRMRNHVSRMGLTRDTAAGPVWNGVVRRNPDWLEDPLRWRAPRRIFVCAHGDLFHESVPDTWIDEVFAVMALAPQHQFQVLTKRPARALEYLSSEWRWTIVEGTAQRIYSNRHPKVPDTEIVNMSVKLPLANVWIGTSVENQDTADERIPVLVKIPAAVRFLSCEPLLGPIDLEGLWGHAGSALSVDLAHWPINWVIVGGESGAGARPMHTDWARDLRDQCRLAEVAFFMKQMWGETKRGMAPIPDDLMIREYPKQLEPIT